MSATCRRKLLHEKGKAASSCSRVGVLACLVLPLRGMEVAVEGPPPVKDEKRADAKPEIASV
jgi:hypothetical protein